MKIIYVAGPYRADLPWGVDRNVHRAREAGVTVALAGAMPLIPHANTAHFDGLAPDAFWLEGTLELLRRCDAVYVFSENWKASSGTRNEVAEATRLGLPVFYPDDIRAMQEWIKAGEL